MSPEEVELLQGLGEVFIFNISGIVTRSVLYGLYLAIFAFGIRTLLKRNPWTKYTWTLFGFFSVLFLISTASLATFVAFNISFIRGVIVDNADQPLMHRLQLSHNSVQGLRIAVMWLGSGGGGGFLFVFADAVVVWRAYVLWTGNKIAKAVLLILLLASFGSAIVSAALGGISFLQSGVVPTSIPTGIMLSFSQSLSLTTNVVATILIGYKTCDHRRMMKASMGVQSSSSAAILLFLTESGVAFCVIQVIALATNVPNNTSMSTLSYAADTWQDITNIAAAAYPVLVVIIVESHRSISDHTQGALADSGFAQGPHAGRLGVEPHMSFAAPISGISSNGSGVGTGSVMIESRLHPAARANGKSERSESVHCQDLEQGEGLNSDGVLPYGRR